MQVNKVNWFSVVVPSTKALVIYMPQDKNKQTLKDTFWVAEDLMRIQTVERGKTSDTSFIKWTRDTGVYMDIFSP